MTSVDWNHWSVVLLKPGCLLRGLTEAVLIWIGEHVTVVDRRIVRPTEQQIFAHYHDLLTTRLAYFTWVDVPADLRRRYVGQRVGLALAHGENATPRLRALMGDFDPSLSGTDTVRGRFGSDSLSNAQAEGRLIANLIHTSDDPEGAEREFGIWYGPSHSHLLHPPVTTERSLR